MVTAGANPTLAVKDVPSVRMDSTVSKKRTTLVAMVASAIVVVPWQLTATALMASADAKEELLEENVIGTVVEK